jgi:hypothetical protein
MADLDRLQQDLGFVRHTVARSGLGQPVATYFLWSVLMLIGFALADAQPVWVGYYWLVAGTLGGVISAVFGIREQKRRGEIDSAVGEQWTLHWAAFMAAVMLLVMMAVRGGIAWASFGPIVLLLLALTYFHAGLYLSPPLRWIGLLAGVGYVVVLTVSTYPWTIVGIVMAAACATAGIQEWRARGVAI